LEPDPLPVRANAIYGRVFWTVPGLGSLVTMVRGAPAVTMPMVVFAQPAGHD